MWGFSSAGRAPALQAGGQRFDPANLHQDYLSQEEVAMTEKPKGSVQRDRKAALGNMPVAYCNRRGFSAEKRSRSSPPNYNEYEAGTACLAHMGQ